ncbi:hypothetical protein F4804DRAFT_350822 [Jackrogersella minutella]|nr:hypothetical protein F4804DRAFT_350822 [Jackrogersella minutella]
MQTTPPPTLSKPAHRSNQISDKALMVGSSPHISAPEKSQAVTNSCQAIVLYHTCGCKSSQKPVYFCSTVDCQHETATLLVAGLPFACCSSQSSRSEACQIEDISKKMFVREADTGTTLQNLKVLPNCTRDDIDALVTPYAGSDNQAWDDEIYNHYQERRALESIGIPSQEAAPLAPDASVKGANFEETSTNLEEQIDIQGKSFEDESNQTEENRDASLCEQEEQQEDEITEDPEIDEGAQIDMEMFQVGDGESDVSDISDISDFSEFMDVNINSEYDIDEIYNDKSVLGVESHSDNSNEANVETNLEGKFKRESENDAEDNIDSLKGSQPRPVGTVEESGKIHDRGYDDYKDIFPPAQPAEASSQVSRFLNDALDENEMSDDFIDFLISAGDISKPQRQTAIGKLLSFFRTCT